MTFERGPRIVPLLELMLVALFAAGCHAAEPAAPPSASGLTTGRSAPAADQTAQQDRYDLGPDEQRGGHTLERHVGRSDEQLRERLRREREVTAASTYTDRATAEHVVALTLSRNRARIDAWLAREGDRPNLALDYRGQRGESLGRSIRRGSRSSVPCSDALVVLRWRGGRSFYVLTTYPEAGR